MYRVFLVEDDPGIAEAVCRQAEIWDLQILRVKNFRMVLEEFQKADPHLVLMDITLPFFNGYHWCQQIRACSDVPILFLSSAADNLNMVMAMNLGADDFLAKPFDLQVLMAKMQAMLRRAYQFAAPAPVLEHRGARLNLGDYSLTYQGKKIPLSKNEHRILTSLMERSGQVISREKLMQALWQTDNFVDENTLSVNVNRLRKKLDAAGLHGFIVTKFGVGYLVE